MADIDLSSIENWEPIGSAGSQFSGTLDGNWHTIKDLTIRKDGNYYTGLFGYICKPAIIRNLKLQNVAINVSSTADIGSLVGSVRNDFGSGNNIIIENCYAEGVVTNSSTGKTGGLVGLLYSSGASVNNCYANVTVSGMDIVGGLVGGAQSSSINNSYATGNLSGGGCTGGLVGQLYYGSIFKSYATGFVTSSSVHIGGLTGESSSSNVQYSYYDSDTTSQNDSGKGDRKTTVEMKTKETFSNWESNIWNIIDNQYPILKSFSSDLHTVTYSLNEGSGIVPTESSKAAFEVFTVAGSDSLIPPTNPDGVIFKEWNTESNGKGIKYSLSNQVGMPAHDLTLYAIWSNKYIVSYNANGGSNPPASESLYVGDLFRISSKLEMIAPNGKQFVEWNTTEDGTGNSYNPYDALQMPKQNLTLYAIWETFQDGSESAPYLVGDYNDLYRVMYEPNSHYMQTNNITLPDPEELGENSNWGPTLDELSCKEFTGSFDGCGFTISKLIINNTKFPATGFFDYVSKGAIVKNVNLKDINISSTYSNDDDFEYPCVGGLAGYNEGTLKNCTVSGTILGRRGTSLGGIAGINAGEIINCTDNAIKTHLETETLCFDVDEGKFFLDDSPEPLTNLQGWSYNSQDKILTLDDFTWPTLAPTALIICGDEESQLTIHLADGSNNYFLSYFNGSEKCFGLSAGIYSDIGALIIQGNSTLVAKGGSIISDVDEMTQSFGIHSRGDIIINGGSIDASGGHTTLSYGIISSQAFIINGGTIKSIGDTAALGVLNRDSDEGIIYITPRKYHYWTNTVAASDGANGPIDGKNVPFDNTGDGSPYKYVKIETMAENNYDGGNSAAPTTATDINHIISIPLPKEGKEITFKSDLATLTIPSNMLDGILQIKDNKYDITISIGDKSNLTESLRAAIGDHPFISLNLKIDGKITNWYNPDAPVKVSIPYKPTAEELLNPESIVIWYIDGNGNAITVPNGHYNALTGMVTFQTTHFSNFAVAYKQINFSDVPKSAWYAKAVDFISAREITLGTGNKKFSPKETLTRGDFIVMLMRSYEIAPASSPKDNFADGGNTYYTDYLNTAKKLGIAEGIGNNYFAPNKEITRQEMFTMMYKALKSINKLPQGKSTKLLNDYSDINQIKPWAKDAVAFFVESGLIQGDSGKLNPEIITTRAEMAQTLYKTMLVNL